MSWLPTSIGTRAETQAQRFLKQQGLTILGKNKRYKCGEIDLIAMDADTTIFVEVKYRKNADFGAATEMVSTAKQTKIGRAAKLWLLEEDPQFSRACRFDVIAIQGAQADDIHWLKNAFSPELW